MAIHDDLELVGLLAQLILLLLGTTGGKTLCLSPHSKVLADLLALCPHALLFLASPSKSLSWFPFLHPFRQTRLSTFI